MDVVGEGSPHRGSRREREERGRAVRERVPLDAHADLVLDGRPDPVALLEGQAATRLPELVPLRYARMLTTRFAHYRGAALVMASDLARTPRTGLDVQLCGDAHMSNFGFYASPERRLVFDLNDFDETYPGPFEWDAKRLAASLAVAGRDNGFNAKQRRRVVRAAAAAYRAAMADLAALGTLAMWYEHLAVDEVLAEIGSELDGRRVGRARDRLAKARTRDSTQALAKLTSVVDGRARIRSRPPLLVPVEDMVDGEDLHALYARMEALVDAYGRTLQPDRRRLLGQFHLVQMARKVVGVGSVGTRAWILLLKGVDDADPLFLQVKEAGESVLAAFVPGHDVEDQGRRVVEGQQLLQATSDILLGWQRADGIDGVERDFYVRQLRDGKGSVVVEAMAPDAMEYYGRICGRTLARAHARSGDRVAIAAYLGRSDRFDRAIGEFAEAYARQNASDHAALGEAAASGRVAVADEP
ncbi:DUF2252 domain-containing protein [Cellulomonas sp. S1-8]|uniref:DUF2252 domain-containing protein n=1 Tax=Cellulomonas sp. S1-8 TaxID=2904790 RepID=UPI00224340C6|nr:DUF2252 domain-containing protein [Cellulomonas sp. S1-8]UZN01570.1 DUF2252 domain-containing protein [Cellulomonas sp. S1-8]